MTWTADNPAVTADNPAYTADGGEPVVVGFEDRGEYQILEPVFEDFRRLWFDWQPAGLGTPGLPIPIEPGGTVLTLFIQSRDASDFQEGPEASITGTLQLFRKQMLVVDAEMGGASVEGATVRLFRMDEGLSVITDEAGIATFNDLDPEIEYHAVVEYEEGMTLRHARSEYPVVPEEVPPE